MQTGYVSKRTCKRELTTLLLLPINLHGVERRVYKCRLRLERRRAAPAD